MRMDQAFALETLHEDPAFRSMMTMVSTPELSPTPALDMGAVAAFLSEMDQLSDLESMDKRL